MEQTLMCMSRGIVDIILQDNLNSVSALATLWKQSKQDSLKMVLILDRQGNKSVTKSNFANREIWRIYHNLINYKVYGEL